MGLLDWVIVLLAGFIMGWALFKFWDYRQTSPILAAIRDECWLKPIEEADTHAPLDAQASFDYANSYAASLRGVFASPTPAKLERLNALLASPHNLEDQLWRDMPMRLKETFRSYGREYTALVETVAEHSDNPVQLYAAFRLAICLPDAPQKVRDLGLTLAENPAVKKVKRKG